MPPRNRCGDPVGRLEKQRFGSPKRPGGHGAPRVSEMIARTPPSLVLITCTCRPVRRAAPRSPLAGRLFPGHMPLEGPEHRRRAQARASWPAPPPLSSSSSSSMIEECTPQQDRLIDRRPDLVGWVRERLCFLLALISWISQATS